MFDQVGIFNKTVIGIERKTGPIEDKMEVNWCVGVLNEEIKEFREAHEAQDFIGQIDAVVDLMYFAAGIMTRMGIPAETSEEIFEHIHHCNMEKHKGTKAEREVPIGLDAIKPEGWVGPEEGIGNILSALKLRVECE